MQQPLEGEAGGGAEEPEPLAKFEDVADAFPQQEECVAVLTMKCGEPLMAVRKKLHDEIQVTFIPEEGFGVFQSKIERHFSKVGANYVQERRAIYLKPSSNATQSKYVLLDKDNFDTVLRTRWKVARSMKVELKYEVFCYFVDATAKKEKKRPSMKMIQQQQQQQQQQQLHHHQLLPESPSADMLASGAAAANNNFMGFGQAPPGFPLAASLPQGIHPYSDVGPSLMGDAAPPLAAPPKKIKTQRTGAGDDNDRPRKAARVPRTDPMDVSAASDAFARSHHHHQQDGSMFQSIMCRINGHVVPIEIDIVSLRRALGLLPSPGTHATDAAVAAAAAAAAAAVDDLESGVSASSAQQYDR